MRNFSLLVAMIPGFALAQWSTSVSEATTLFLSGGPQVQPKVSFFGNRAVITNFDNSTGGYDVYARVTDFGFLAPALPTLVADRTFSSTQDYDLDGRALIYRDNSSGTQGITVSLLNADGTVANSRFWPGSQNQPKVAVLENGTIACGWSETGGFRIQIVDGTTLADASPSIFETETGHGLTLSDLATGENDRVIAMWVRTFTTSFLSAKWLYAQKYDSAGARLWNGGLPSMFMRRRVPRMVHKAVLFKTEPSRRSRRTTKAGSSPRSTRRVVRETPISSIFKATATRSLPRTKRESPSLPPTRARFALVAR